jgi:hypothetical protein
MIITTNSVAGYNYSFHGGWPPGLRSASYLLIGQISTIRSCAGSNHATVFVVGGRF